ncbi:DsbA family oxidoreductase [Candidatus Clostridium radicumherbarum]|uniref:DsbA family protein n=1 Tax=Candidatus Clostridium radicumherbarum TaxID=3381662 RepID=A0ABW8TMU6_9CLOT
MGKGIVEKLKEEFDIEDEWLPFEIHPETPMEGMELTKKFPGPSLNKMISNLKAMGKLYGIEFNEFTILSNSHLALAAGEYAKENGKFHELHTELFRGYFALGKDIGDINVLTSIVKNVGLDAEELLKRLESKHYDKRLSDVQKKAYEYEINSTPTFIIDGKYAIVGAQGVEYFREALMRIEKEQ